MDLAENFREAGLQTYFYHLTYRSSQEAWPDWMGVIHAAEISVRERERERGGGGGGGRRGRTCFYRLQAILI